MFQVKVARLLAITAISLCPVAAQSALFKSSTAAVTAANVLDARSSWGKYELNPVLGSGKYGWRQTAIKSGITSAMIFAEAAYVKRHPRSARLLAITNFAVAAVVTGVAVRNFRLSGPTAPRSVEWIDDPALPPALRR